MATLKNNISIQQREDGFYPLNKGQEIHKMVRTIRGYRAGSEAWKFESRRAAESFLVKNGLATR